jgi:putative endonuclease
LNHIEFGASGEEAAARYIERLGWRVVARNVRVGRGELDIVAIDGDELVIVEVRSRRIGLISPAETTVGPMKLGRVIRTARMYVEKIAFNGIWRIDIAAVTMDSSGCIRVELFSDATAGLEGGFMG